ncbi:IMPACT family protein, partial [Thermus scotoductus]
MAYTLAAPVVHEETIQKSRFIAKAAPVASEEEALAFLEAQREPQATHNCYAYKLGNLYRFFDDGEPTGTAGKPILHAIEAQGLDRVVVLVVRYFGGIKLGAGGLVRA